MSDFTPRPTVYNGVKMRSRLEAGYAMWLDERGIEWEYEPQCFALELGQYLPDFRVNVALGDYDGIMAPVYIEVKYGWEAADLEEQFRNARIIVAALRGRVPCHEFLVAVRDDGMPVATLWSPMPDGWRPYIWTLLPGDRDLHALVYPLQDDERPWPDGYWRGKS